MDTRSLSLFPLRRKIEPVLSPAEGMGAPGLTRSALFAAPLALAIGVVLLLAALSCGGPETLAGTVMDPARDAPDFSPPRPGRQARLAGLL